MSRLDDWLPIGAILSVGGFGVAGYFIWQSLAFSCPTGTPCIGPVSPWINPFVYEGIIAGTVGLWLVLRAMIGRTRSASRAYEGPAR